MQIGYRVYHNGRIVAVSNSAQLARDFALERNLSAWRITYFDGREEHAICAAMNDSSLARLAYADDAEYQARRIAY